MFPAPVSAGVLVVCKGQEGLLQYMRTFYDDSPRTTFECVPVILKVANEVD